MTISRSTATLSREKSAKTLGSSFEWVRKNLFSTWLNTLLTVLVFASLVWFAVPAFRWAFIDSIWSAGNANACEAAAGACWAFIGEWYRFILFGRFPFEQQWRPLLVIIIFIVCFGALCVPSLRGKPLISVLAVGAISIFVLMSGGVLGLAHIDTSFWNGLPLTLILSVFGLVAAFPFALVLALGRRSRRAWVRIPCTMYIELIRGVPLVTVLFLASVMLPAILPGGNLVDKLVRAEVAFALFYAAYLAEAIRGGLQAIPNGQYEAAEALGVRRSIAMRLIILPQALTLVIPAMTNIFISAFKDTTLVLVIGMYDLLLTTTTALGDPEWRGFYLEGYVFTSAIYFGFCYFMSKYSGYLEKAFNRGHKH
ncbi:amino acid ABC transporter permease [Pseudomonas sp. DWRC2-2]|uniref:amino acid ABC transporter permease n=1 Tax=Pseudomonas sp. DWRC2-2 TaxID=2804567 RepID=UPI003CF8DC39